MGSIPPLHDQVRSGSARLRARERALSWLGRPSYLGAIVLGAVLGAVFPILDFVERALPSLMPYPPFTARQMVERIPTSAAIGATVALSAAALLRFARWAYFRARFGARAT